MPTRGGGPRRRRRTVRRCDVTLPRIVALVGGLIVIPLALGTAVVGLDRAVHEDPGLRYLMGILGVFVALVALAGAACALWARGFNQASLGPLALVLYSALDIVLRGTFFSREDLLPTLGLTMGMLSATLVFAARWSFRPLRAFDLRHRGEGTHDLGWRLPARGLSLAGGALLVLVGVGVVMRGYDHLGGTGDEGGTGRVFLLLGVVVILSGGLAMARLALWLALLGSGLALCCGAWEVRLGGQTSVTGDPLGAVAVWASLMAYMLLALSWPVFGPARVWRERPPGADDWKLPETPGGSAWSLLGGASQVIEGQVAEERLEPTPWSALWGLFGGRGEGEVKVVPPPPSPQMPHLMDYIVEEVFVIYYDGRLICACAREDRGTRDADLMSGMLVAIMGLIMDGLDRTGKLESIKFGFNILLLAQGQHVILAAVVYGEPDRRLKEGLQDLVRSIEGSHAGVIEDWDGDTSRLVRVTDIVSPLVLGTAHLSRDVVRQAVGSHLVEFRSVMDFHQGYVRLSVLVVNGLPDQISDASVEVDYDSDLIRLERVAPVGTHRRGDRVILGDVPSGDRALAAFFLDPLVPERCFVDGSLTYLDVRGRRRRVEMRRHYADVMCPIFFTPENINTAVLRTLIRERLHCTETRMFKYPPGLPPEDVLLNGKLAMDWSGMLQVKEYIREGVPFQAEVWYYGETQEDRAPIVVRLGVVEEQEVLELYAASTAMEPVMGLQTEFRNELERVYQERYAGVARLVRSRDPGMRRELEGRPLMLDRGVG